MNELLEFLTSKEIIVVYIVAALACLLCFIIYLVEKNNESLRRKHNTKELNRLVEEIQEEVPTTTETVNYEVPVLEQVSPNKEAASSVAELLENTNEMLKVNEPVAEKKEENVVAVDTQKSVLPEQKTEYNIPVITNVIAQEQPAPIKKEEEELQYTSVEPDQATARLELEKLTQELKRQEEETNQPENIALTNYEEEQEKEAIISLQELVKKSKEMYEANELTQYADEGNEPISLQDLEKKMGNQKAPSYDEPFIIENVVPEEMMQEELEAVTEPVQAETKKVTLDDFNTIQQPKKFQSSPIISPIYGIEKKESIAENELALENTANYEKLDEEIKRTNEFLMTLKELQKHLD